MRFYTAFDGDKPILTINADSEPEAQHVLAALLGDHALRIRRSSPDEVAAWAESATQPRGKMRRLRKKDPAATNATGHKVYEESQNVTV
jgi:hypothetical protein